MRYTCTRDTDMDDLLGREEASGEGYCFRDGPLVEAMRRDEELILEDSRHLSGYTVAKIRAVIRNFFVVETHERLFPGKRFHVTFA